MEKRQRDLFRLADLICAAAKHADHERPLPQFPDFAWDAVLTWRRHLAFAQSRSWFAAVAECRQELDSALHELVDQANTARQRVREIDKDSHEVRLRDVYDELVALDSEFGDVVWDCRDRTLSVTTESIEIDDMNLGPFKIVLNWGDLSVTRPYQIIALEPNAAAGDDRFCRHCLTDCSGCKHGFCKGCLTDGSCDECRHKTQMSFSNRRLDLAEADIEVHQDVASGLEEPIGLGTAGEPINSGRIVLHRSTAELD